MRSFGTLLLLACLLPARGLAEDKRDAGPWDLETLRRAPEATLLEPDAPVTGVYYPGEPYRGRPTRVFGWLARPHSKGKHPAMVLVHGGGGTAYREWAELWAGRGYVALAMDLAGHGPDKARLDDGGPDQSDAEKFLDADPKEMWTYHAVADVIRGVSLLANRPEVDAEKIGITGISWGGYLTCIVSGLDDRLKVSIPVYGCGFIHENSYWLNRFASLPEQGRRRWTERWEPSKYVGQAKMPVLFVNGTNDFAYPLDSYQKTYRRVKHRQLCVTVNMPHGHPQGWAPVEIGLFADQHLINGKPLPRIAAAKRDGDTATVEVAFEVPLHSAGLHYTKDTGEWQKRQWTSVPLKLTGGQATASLPKDRPLVYFLTVTDERKATVSTEHESLE